MNKIEEFEKNLKAAYLNYENGDLKEALKYLDEILETLLKEDKSLENYPILKILSYDVFKAIVLNNFYNKVELTRNSLDSLLENQEELKKNIKEFCNNFRNNELINFIDHFECININEKLLKYVIKILMSNIEKMNVPDINVETNNDNNINLMDVVKYAQKLFRLKYKYCVIKKGEYIYHLLYVDDRLLKSEYGGDTFQNCYYSEEAISFLGTQLDLLKNPTPMSFQRYQVDVDESKTEVKKLDSFECHSGLWIKGEDYTICYDYPPFSIIEQQSLESKYNIPHEMRGACYIFTIFKNSNSKHDVSYWEKIVKQTLMFLEDKQKLAIEYFIKKLYGENSISPKDMLDFFKNISVKPDVMEEFLFAYTNEFHFYDIIKKNNLNALKLSVLDYFVKLAGEVESIDATKDIIEVINNQNSKNTFEAKENIKNIVEIQNISYLENNREVQEKIIIFTFTIIDINKEYITIKTNPMCEVINGKINLNNPKTEFKLYKNLELTLATPTTDRRNTYKLSVKSKKDSSLEKNI